MSETRPIRSSEKRKIQKKEIKYAAHPQLTENKVPLKEQISSTQAHKNTS
jgi:hypothetical protein